ncbi:NADH-quinone oxidoreductase subunit NuoE [Jongsikchunia kroppenstedtii]|uniref:NADH-quinone oxidoreductase subunit NuoE n=1 Tax=Jongsikchunia kroppenstedtii TaxID=1121721 RepID=UPI0003715442|nr:NADH-quinone oxidoreductase subunit NuoE [Jongsikchunia kroppenstedtii]
MTEHPNRVRLPDPAPAAPDPAENITYPDDVYRRLVDDATQIVTRYPDPRSALLPLLHLTQSEDGCLTDAGLNFCARQLDLTAAEVRAVATFYSMYRREPTGDYLVGVCTNTLCAVLGGDAVLAELVERLQVAPGATTADGKVTLEHVECNAACDYAPVVMVNWEFFDNQTPTSAADLVDALRAGQVVQPSRGAPLCTFRETCRTLAGLPDNHPDAAAAADAGEPTLVGLRIADENGWAAPDPSEVPPQTAGGAS